MSIFKKILKRLGVVPKITSEQMLNNYRAKGIKIGKGSIIFDTSKILIDISRPELLVIGENVLLHRGTIILTHDYASRCFVNKYCDFIPSHGRVRIGNNVWLGQNVTILKGVTIGDNVIIGAGSIVSKSIPSNSVAVGSPAKVISTFEDYYSKRKKQYIDECIEYANAILDSGREPKKEDFYDDYPCFVDAENMHEYNYPYQRVFTHPEQLEVWKKHHIKTFNGFDDFMKEVYKRREKNE